MDADDISYPHRFQAQYDYLEKNPDTVLLGCFCKITREKDDWSRQNSAYAEDYINRWYLSMYPPFIHSAVMFRKKAFLQSGKYQQTDYPSEDYGLWIRIKRYGKIETIKEVLAEYRLTASGICAKNYKEQINIRDRLSRINLEDIYKQDEIPEITAIRSTLKKYTLIPMEKLALGYLSCLTGCFLLTKGEITKAKSFFHLSLEFDKKRLDALLNFLLLLLNRSFLISLNYFAMTKKFIIKLHWFSGGRHNFF